MSYDACRCYGRTVFARARDHRADVAKALPLESIMIIDNGIDIVSVCSSVRTKRDLMQR